MRLQNRPVTGVPAGRQRDWIPVTTLAVPTVWMATADGLVLLDLLAIELAVNGCRTDDWSLSGPETAYATDFLLQRGMDRSKIARLVGSDIRTLRSWFPEDDTPLGEALTRVRTKAEWNLEYRHRSSWTPAPCGTYRAAQRHGRRKEPLDEACRKAKRAADRHYKQHGTYVGSPEFRA